MTVRLYKSTDASAPTLTGQVDSLCLLLKAILVDGYGSQTGAGWTEEYDGTNKKVFRNSPTNGTGFYLNIDDSGGGTGGAREAFVTGFQTMSGLGVGTGQFPLAAQIALGSSPSGAVVWRKSNSADATARVWYCVADDTCFHLFVETGDNTAPLCVFPMSFGDFFSQNGTSDLYRCLLKGRNQQNTGNSNQEYWGCLHTNMSQSCTGNFIAAQPNGIGTSLYFGQHVDGCKHAAASSNVITNGGTTAINVTTVYSIIMGGTLNPGTMPYPNPVDGALYMSPVWVHHNSMLRGRIKGIWAPCQSEVFNHGETFTGTGEQAGKSFLALRMPNYVNGGSVSSGLFYVEYSNTWA